MAGIPGAFPTQGAVSQWLKRGRSAPPATPRSNAPFVLGPAGPTPGATVPRSPGPGFPGRCVDLNILAGAARGAEEGI
jgi:hypothetical protein